VPRRTLTIEQVLTLLKETPPQLAALTSGLAPVHLQTAPAHNEWSANDVLAHLRACADVWGSSIAAILANEGTPTLRAVNPRTWIKRTDYCELAFGPSLHAYATQRAALLSELDSLPPEGWSRTARVIGAGAALERTVQDYAQRLARHEQPHIQQIAHGLHSLHSLHSVETRHR